MKSFHSSLGIKLSWTLTAMLTASEVSLTSAAEGPTTNLQDCIPQDEFDLDVDYFPFKFLPRDYSGPPADFFPDNYVPHSTTDLFEITYHKYYKIVTNKFQNKSYLLYQCGTEPPKDQLDGRHHLVLPVPHKGGLAITETPQIPPVELLGKRRDIIAYIGNPEYVSSPCMNHMMEEEGSIQLFFDPDDPWNSTKTKQMKQDFLEENPNAIIFEGPYGDKDGERALAIAASQERTNVATFDWIGLYGALFNLEAEANRIAAETLERYECSSTNAARLSADLPEDQRPTVLWANYFDGYNWSVAECTTWDETYYCEYAKHCGANILGRPEDVGYAPASLGGNYWYLNDDELLKLGKDADVWIYPSNTWDKVYAEKKEIMDQFKAVQNKKVYDTQGQGSNAWYEQRLAEYDVVGLDFCDLVGNTNPATLHVRRWFRNIFNEPIGTLEACNVPDEIDERYVPTGADCEPLTTVADSSTSGAHATRFSVILLSLLLIYGVLA